MAMSWDQLLSLVGALMILSAYALQTFGPKDAWQKTNALLNLFGSSALTLTAYVNHQIGFILLEGIWALISARALVKAIKGAKSS